ncbi:unnamed protein product [Oikopleura dioica]|uniref:Peptidase S1 domain-containing protein n=1 Tax=Oikopleura dioica TaxID=34765 RepID=E4XM82_OIKDI|nr:unnamed protein product [Oikopleura dioica]
MKLSAAVFTAATAWEQPTYSNFLRSLGQKKSGWGAPEGRIAAAHSLCPALDTPDNGSIVCDQSTCALVCDEGFVATGRRRTKCRFNTTKQFFWKRTLGECDTCPDLAAPPAGVEATCTLNWMGKKKCVYKCANGEDITANGSSFGGITSVCACPRWNNRVCGWNTRKLQNMITDSDVAGFSCPDVPETTTAAPPASTTAAPPASTTAAPPASSTAAPPASTTAAPPASTTAAPVSTTGPAPEFETLSNDIPSTLTTCGPSSRSIEKIVNGIDATQTHWPWIARLFLKVNVGDNSGFSCGGSIINDNWVITAAHCCEGMAEVDATFNDADKQSFETGEFTSTSTQLFNHPMYGDSSDGSGSNMDICLIKFSDSLIQTGTAPVCLSTSYPEHGKACWVAGWGTLSSGGNSPDLLQSVGVNILGQDYCQAKSNNGALLPDDICAGSPDVDGNGLTDAGIDSCQGDSGGPLVCDVNGAATLVGVVSRGTGCGDEGFPGLYTAIHTDSWIETTIAANTP